MADLRKSSDSVVVSGLGVVACHGCELDDHRAALAGGTVRLTEVDREAGYHRRGGARTAATVDPASYRAILSPIKARRMSPPSRFAVVAARQALADAGLEDEVWKELDGETAVVLGTSYGPSSYTERILRQVFLESPQAASPMLFTESVANAPAAQVALGLGCRGPNITVTQREASALMAVAEGAALVRMGRARRALVGGVEEVNPLLHAVLDRFGALAGSRGAGSGGGEQARPLDARRRGFNAAEGAAVLVLERRQDAERRSAPVRAVVGPSVRGFDAGAPPTGWSREAPATARRLAGELERVSWSRAPEVFVSGANGSRDGDRFEASLVRAVGLDAPVITPKRVFGELGVAPVVGALLAMEGSVPSPGEDFVEDPELGLTPAADVPARGRFLLSSTAAGGSCCWLGLESS